MHFFTLKEVKNEHEGNLILNYGSHSPQKSNHFSLAREKLIFPAKDCILEILISACKSITSLSSENIHFHLFPSHSVKHSVRMKRFPEWNLIFFDLFPAEEPYKHSTELSSTEETKLYFYIKNIIKASAPGDVYSQSGEWRWFSGGPCPWFP